MWEYFFETTETVKEGIGFEIFGKTHLIWLFSIALLGVLLCMTYIRSNESGRRAILWTVCILTLCNEIAKYTVLGISGNFKVDYLPLHLCSINIFVILAYMITKKAILAEILYAASLPGALAALLFPSWTALPPTSFMHIHSFTVHFELMIFPLLLLVGGFVPSFRRLSKAFPAILSVAVFVYIFNKIFDTSFMFLNGAGEGNPLSFFEDILGDPLYIVSIPFLLCIVWGVMYGIPLLGKRMGMKMGIGIGTKKETGK